jgi:hypothetical protein
MKIPLVYGLLMAVVGALLMYGLFFAGFFRKPTTITGLETEPPTMV